MRSFDIERWVVSIVEQVKAHQPVEDTRVELKSTWIDPQKAARRIAGHLNASRGEQALWIIGLDEKQGVVGVNRNDFANWWAQVKAEFEEVCPELKDHNVPIDDKVVVALLFESDRAPYVIKSENQKFEVPWRDGTSIRSAKRQDLMKLYIPFAHKPI